MAEANRMSLVRTTVELEEQARRLARRLVKERLAACVHVQRIASTYMWKGEVHEGNEWLVEARSPEAVAEACWLAMAKGHPYEVPMVELVGGVHLNGAYTRWAQGVMDLE